jgi:hypothetical protein
MTGSRQPQAPADLPTGKTAHGARWRGDTARISAGLNIWRIEKSLVPAGILMPDRPARILVNNSTRIDCRNDYDELRRIRQRLSHATACFVETQNSYYGWSSDDTWVLAALNTCNKTLHSDNWSKWVTCHEFFRESYCGNEDAVKFSMV